MFRMAAIFLSLVILFSPVSAQDVRPGTSPEFPVNFTTVSITDLVSIALRYGISEKIVEYKLSPTTPLNEFEVYDRRNALIDDAKKITDWNWASPEKPVYLEFSSLLFRPKKYNFDGKYYIFCANEITPSSILPTSYENNRELSIAYLFRFRFIPSGQRQLLIDSSICRASMKGLNPEERFKYKYASSLPVLVYMNIETAREVRNGSEIQSSPLASVICRLELDPRFNQESTLGILGRPLFTPPLICQAVLISGFAGGMWWKLE